MTLRSSTQGQNHILTRQSKALLWQHTLAILAIDLGKPLKSQSISQLIVAK